VYRFINSLFACKTKNYLKEYKLVAVLCAVKQVEAIWNKKGCD
jgi:hypothetical protein